MRRAAGGGQVVRIFLMGRSMFLECQFATIDIGLAAGGYVACLINPEHLGRKVNTAFVCALVFLAIQHALAAEDVSIPRGLVLARLHLWRLCIALETPLSDPRVLPAQRGRNSRLEKR